MSYLCKDCSYRGKSSGQGGACPACGSYDFNILRDTSGDTEGGHGRVRLAILGLLWAWLIGLILWKLGH